MKAKKFVIAVSLLAIVAMSAGSANAFGFGPAGFGLGAFGSALGFAISGTAQAAAIGGLAGMAAGALLTPPYYYYGAPAPRGAYYPPVGYYRPVPRVAYYPLRPPVRYAPVRYAPARYAPGGYARGGYYRPMPQARNYPAVAPRTGYRAPRY